MDMLCCYKQKSLFLQHHLYCSSPGARVWVGALPEAHTVVTFIPMGSGTFATVD